MNTRRKAASPPPVEAINPLDLDVVKQTGAGSDEASAELLKAHQRRTEKEFFCDLRRLAERDE